MDFFAFVKPKNELENTAEGMVHVSSLDGNYAAFGYVTEGMEIVDRICTEAKPIDNNGKIASEAQPVIESITITETREKNLEFGKWN